jgi:transcriptional regulator with XRE-family HTH domain
MKQSGKAKPAKKAATEPNDLQKRQGKALAQALDAINITQRDFADLVGLTESRVSQFLKGISFPSTRLDIAHLAKWSGASVDALERGEYLPDSKWFPVRKESLPAKIDALLKLPGMKPQIIGMIDTYYSQHCLDADG